jgi:hypothetical protein
MGLDDPVTFENLSQVSNGSSKEMNIPCFSKFRTNVHLLKRWEGAVGSSSLIEELKGIDRVKSLTESVVLFLVKNLPFCNSKRSSVGLL